ncbi:MAG: electron-transfer flavoprotein:ubiquinone oxidoreductase, partial [Acidobacteriota bacterium]
MSEEEREILDIDVLFVGAGPASLAGAYHLGKLIEAHNEAGEGEPIEAMIAVLEKGEEIGSHALSGAVVDPKALQELMPDEWQDAPFEGKVEKEGFLYMTKGGAKSLPVPPPLVNKGKYVASLGRLMKWLAPKLEEMEIDVFCEFPAQHALYADNPDGSKRVIGVRTGDRGVGKDGQPKSNYEPGVDIHSKVVVLGEGPRGTVAKQLEQALGLTEGKNPQVYAIGIKEIWQLPEGRIEPGEVYHTMGEPLGWSTFGGGFIYGMKDNQAIVGLVVGLDYKNPHLDPHNEFNRFKTNPYMRDLLEGGEMLIYGAKAIPEGGWWAMPKNHGDGFLITGDSGGFLNGMKLKGVHIAMKSGMLAAETIFEGLKAGDMGEERMAAFQEKIEKSWIYDELWPARNFHQAFERGGNLAVMAQAGLGMVTGGLGFGIANRLDAEPGHEAMQKLTQPKGWDLAAPSTVEVDGQLTFDKLGDVYNSGTAHEEDQPVHLQ